MLLSSGFDTARGLRPVNEDAGLADSMRGFAVVADGLGGPPGGDVASWLAVEVSARWVAAELPGGVGPVPGWLLLRLVERANAQIYARAWTRPELRGMGTTLDVLVVRCGEYLLAHVGDSRAYRVRGREIEQLTRDHSLVQERVDAGLLTPEAARVAPDRNILTRAVGVGPSVVADVGRGDVRAGDLFVLTTDGVHGVLSDPDIRELVEGVPPDEAAGRLVAAALAAGSTDNATAALLACAG